MFVKSKQGAHSASQVTSCQPDQSHPVNLTTHVLLAGETHPGAALQDILRLRTLCIHHINARCTLSLTSHILSPGQLFLLAGETHPGAALQDILRLLTLWFNHGSAPDVEAALQEGFGHVSIDTWLVVIPQVNLLLCFYSYHCRLAWVSFASKPLRQVICDHR